MTLRSMRLSLILTCLLPGVSAQAEPGDIFYVNVANDTGVEDGLSWNTAFSSIEKAIELARTQFGGEVWVARGVYDNNRTPANGALILRPGVDVFGGFAGTETLRSRRNPALNPTVIDGSKSASGNAAQIVVIGADNVILDGFLITGGRGTAGTGLLNVGTSPVVRNCTFSDNRATQFGGAVLNLEGARAEFTNCRFVANMAEASGGAVANTDSEVTYTDCLFSANIAEVAGGAMFNTPGSDVFISRCRFELNIAEGGGGAMFNEGASPLIQDSHFISNKAGGFGGAIFNNQAVDVNVVADTLLVN